MKFGPVPARAAAGAILAHSVALPKGRLGKGRVLTEADVAALGAAGVAEVTVARLSADDIGEDAAATMIAEALVPDPEAAGLRLAPARTGRVNIHATKVGLVALDRAKVGAVNAACEDITLATLPPWARMAPGGLVATVKIIPYGLPRADVQAAAEAGRGALALAPIVVAAAELIVTSHDAGSGEETGKGHAAIEARLAALGMTLERVTIVAHDTGALAAAIATSTAPMVLVLTASATSDAQDVGPAALRQAGGAVTRFGLPVDPGNLLFYGTTSDGRAFIGLPGCARSPALNGADWVLNRLAAGLALTPEDIAEMGVGGLLKDIPGRISPRGD
jgi:molybdenum cofactor cytidylyltransferase